jgi:hypothetical protein
MDFSDEILDKFKILGLHKTPWCNALAHSVNVHPSWFSVTQGTTGLRTEAAAVSQDLLRFFSTSIANRERS